MFMPSLLTVGCRATIALACFADSPQTDTTPVDIGPVLITEIMYDPGSSEIGGGTEWIELCNVSDETITLRNWRLDDEDRSDWGPFSCTLAPLGVVVLVNRRAVDARAFHAAWDDDHGAPGYAVVPVKWGGLANNPSHDNECLTLLDDRGVVRCRVNLHGDPSWPDGRRASLHLAQPGVTDPNLGTSWRRSTLGQGLARSSRQTAIFDATEVGSPGVVPELAEVIVAPDDTTSPPAEDASSDC